MAKHEQTKAEAVLLDARTRVAGALAAVSVAETALEVAKATLHAHRETFDALEKALVSKPRKKSVAVAPAQTLLPASEETGPMCGICHHAEDYMDHSGPSPNFHEFGPPKSVARAPRKSKQKPEATLSDQNSEIGKGVATDAARAASGN